MKIRQSYLEKLGTIGDAETKTWNLSYQKPITALDIYVQATIGATGGSNGPIPKQLTDVQVVDGAFTLFSLPGHIAYGEQFGRKNGVPFQDYATGAGETADAFFRICFGRYFGDKQYYLDPTKFSNPQLRITSAFEIDATKYVTGSGKVSVLVHTLDEGADSQAGVMMTKEISRPSLAASAESTVDLPVDYPYYHLSLYANDAVTDPDAVISNVKVSVDNDTEILYDIRIQDLLFQNIQDLGEDIYNIAQFTSINTGDNVSWKPSTALYRGFAPFGGVYLPFDPQREGDFYTPSSDSSVRAILTGGGSGGKTRVVLTQVYS